MPVELHLECVGADDASEVRIIGDGPVFGNWDPSQGVALRRCTFGPEDNPVTKWQLVGGPLTLSDDPELLPRRLNYCYAMLRKDGTRDYQWEDLGTLNLPLGARRGYCPYHIRRCLMLSGCGHSILARCDRWGVEEGCEELSAWCEQDVWRVSPDFAPGTAGASWAVGAQTCCSAGKPEAWGHRREGAEHAHACALFVRDRRARLLGGLEQLTRQIEERSFVPRHLWKHVDEFLADAASCVTPRGADHVGPLEVSVCQ